MTEAERLRAAIYAAADAIEREAFNIRPPNPHTPVFVMIVNGMRDAANRTHRLTSPSHEGFPMRIDEMCKVQDMHDDLMAEIERLRDALWRCIEVIEFAYMNAPEQPKEIAAARALLSPHMQQPAKD